MGVLDFAVPIISKILNYIPDPTQKMQAEQELMTGFQQWDAQQAQTNTAEAGSENVFVSGWRPFIGWVCGTAFAYKFVVQPVLIFGLLASGSTFDPKTLPVLDWTEMSTVLMGILGLGGMRTFEKIQAGK